MLDLCGKVPCCAEKTFGIERWCSWKKWWNWRILVGTDTCLLTERFHGVTVWNGTFYTIVPRVGFFSYPAVSCYTSLWIKEKADFWARLWKILWKRGTVFFLYFIYSFKTIWWKRTTVLLFIYSFIYILVRLLHRCIDVEIKGLLIPMTTWSCVNLGRLFNAFVGGATFCVYLKGLAHVSIGY